MKFSVNIEFLPNPQEDIDPYISVYNRTERECLFLDQSNYDLISFAEHHFFISHGILPNALLYISYLLPKMKRICLAPGVTVLPHGNPYRTTEEIAFLHALSNGRIEIQVGSGLGELEYKNIGLLSTYVNRYERYKDDLHILLSLLRTGKTHYQSKYWDGAEEVKMNFMWSPELAKCPFSLAVQGPSAFVKYAAENQLGIIVSQIIDIPKMKEIFSYYDQNIVREGGNIDKGALRWVFVAETDDVAEKMAKPILIQRHEEKFKKHPDYIGYDFTQIYADRLGDGILVGSPKTIIKMIENIATQTGCNHISSIFPSYIGEKEMLQSYQLFSSEVIPYFKSHL